MSETTRIVHDKRPQENLDPVTGFRVAGPFVFRELGRTGKHLKRVGA